MDEKQLKALWESMSATHELGDFDAFKKNIYSDSNFRKGFWEEASTQYEIGDYKTFEDSFKKKVPLQPSQSSATPLPSQEPQKPKNPQYLTILGEGQPTPMTERQKKMPTYLGKTTNKLPNIEEAINDATEKAYKNRAVKSPVVKQQIIDSYKNGDLIPVIENGKSVMKRGAGFLKSFIDAVEENNQRNLEDSYVSTLPKDKAISYLNAKMASPETFASKRETAPSGFLGKVGEFLGENIPMLGKATAGAIAGTTLAPETGGSSFGMFLANAKDMANAGYAQNLERNYQAIKEQNPKISDSEAYDKANKAALVGETTSLATNAVLSYAAPFPKNIPTPIPSVETNGVINSLTHAIKSYPKVGGTAVAGSLINDITANLVGNKVEASEMIENSEKSAIDMASMHFGLWALGQPFKIPSYIRPQIENVVASAPREEVKQFYTEMENRGAVPEGTTNKVIDKLEKFDEQKQVVQNMDLSQEQQAAITGKLLQRAKIEEENKTLKKYGGSFNSKIDANQKLIDELDAQIDGITKTKDVLKFERDNVTGEKPSEIGKSVEEQLKPVEEIKVEESETPIEEPITNEEKVKQLRAAEQAEYNAMPNPKDEAKRQEIYDRYDKLITPLLKEKADIEESETYVTDRNEEPLIVYHGAKGNKQIEKFDLEESNKNRPSNQKELGIHFGTKENERALENTGGKEPIAYKIKGNRVLRLDDDVDRLFPLQPNTTITFIDSLPEEVKNRLTKEEYRRGNVDAVRKALLAEGYDVLEYKNYLEDKGRYNYIVLNPKNIERVTSKIETKETPKAETKEQPKVEEEVKQETKPSEKSIIDAHKKADEYINNAQDAYDKAQSERLEYIKKNGYPIGNDPEFDKLVSAKVNAEDRLNQLKKAKDNLLPLPKTEETKSKQEIVQEVKKQEAKPKEVTEYKEIITSNIDNKELRAIVEKNADYFKAVKSGSIGVKSVDFGIEDGITYMDTFDKNGNKVTRYYVSDDKQLTIKKPKTSIIESKTKQIGWEKEGDTHKNNNTGYTIEKDENGRYVVLDSEGYDAVGESFEKLETAKEVADEMYEEGKQEEILPKEELIQEPPIVENIVDGKRKKIDLSKGKKAEIPKEMVFKDEKEHDRFVVDNSENPAEIASIYVSQPKTYNLSSIEMMIAEFGIGKVKFSSYKEYGDGNNMTLSKARSYINKKGRTLDGIAKEMSDHYDYEITPENLVDFIDKFPNGESSALSKKNMVGNDISFDAQQKFYKLTGLKLNDKIAEKAINYEFEKLNKEQKKLIYEQWKSEKELTDAYWEAYKQTDGFTKESNISQAEQPKPAEKAKSRLAPKQDIATQARDLANKLRSGEKQILPDWLKADLPKNTKLSGISFEEAAAKALETFADVYEKVKDTAQAISEALVHLRDWHKENNIEFNETEWKQKFEENLLPKEELKKSKEKEPLKVGISHENLNKLAKKLGLKEVKRGQRLSPEEMAHRGRLLYKAGADVEQIAKDFESGMQPKADDISIVRVHIEELAKKADALEGKGVEYKETTKELYRWISLEKEMGTKASEPFTALQGERDMDTDSFTIVKGEVAKKMEKLGGINAKQERKIRELTEQNKKLKEEAKQAEKKAIEAANKTFREGQQAQVTFTEKAKKVADNFRKLKTKEFIFRDENGNEIQVHKAGVSWNELIELGAKAIEKTGEIADGVAAIIENIKDKEWYQKLSDKDKSNLEKQFAKQFEDAVEETPEAKKIKRLEKEKEDLENGIIKQKNVSNFKPSPEQQEKINQLTEEIKGLKENLGLIKSKQEKPLTEEEQIEQKEKRKEEIIDLLDKNVRDLKNPKNMFSIEEKKAIWKYAKEEYLDKGVDYKEMISLVAEDLGLTWSQMNYAITTPETKKISDEMWIKQSNYRKNQNATKRWVEEQNKNQYEKLIKRISDKVRGISVFGHGGIFVGTHAMMTLFDPLTWKQTVPAFFRAWKYAYGNKANYEIAMQELKNMDNYNMAQRAGLKNNPDIINAEEFQKSQNFLGKLGGAGEQGFNAIKVLRQDLFDYHWNKLTESEKLDLDDKGVPMAAKEIAWLVNNATGATNLKVPEWLNEVTFAGGMEMARWSKLTRNPLRASEIAVRALINPKNASTSEKVFAKVWASRVGRQLGFMASMLAVNYALQNAINPKNKVNLTNPKENDFGKFKFGDINVDMSSGMLGVTRFIRDLVFASTDELEELGGDTRMEKMGKSTIQYARGKLAPFYQKVSDIAFNTDFSGNVLPYSSDKPRQGKHKLGWTEYLWQSAPLPIAEAAHAMYESAAEHGGDPKIVDALVMAAISGGTGAKPSLYKEKQLQFSEQDKEREPFKFFVKKGVEFKELNPYKIEIEDEELGVKKPLDEYPKETIDNFKKIHKENLTESLEKIQEKGYVYIDKFGNLSISRGEGKPKEKIDLTELNKEQLKKIVSLLNSDATDKTKKEVFNQ